MDLLLLVDFGDDFVDDGVAVFVCIVLVLVGMHVLFFDFFTERSSEVCFACSLLSLV